jgi:hypothetical protein
VYYIKINNPSPQTNKTRGKEKGKTHYPSSIIHQQPPKVPITKSAVKNPAPLLLAWVIVEYFGSVFLPNPAFGSPFEVPPELAAAGFLALSISVACTAASADICSPTPVYPSHCPEFQFLPHLLPVSPPEHCCAAPSAEAWSLGIITSRVKGASWMVPASQRDRYALKEV